MDNRTRRKLREIYQHLRDYHVVLIIGTMRQPIEEAEKAILKQLGLLADLIEETNDIELKTMEYDVDTLREDLTLDDLNDLLVKLDKIGDLE